MAPPTKFAEAEAERATLKLTLDTLQSLLNSHATAPLPLETAKDSLELAVKIQQQLLDNQRGLSTYAASDAVQEPYSLEYPDLLTRAIRYCSGFRGLVMTLTPTSSSSASHSGSCTHTSSADIRLPMLQIPMFGGDLEEWISFRDLFEKAIGNSTSLSKAQKLTYLKSYLVDEASRHVATLVISDANYDVAWTTLTNRYQNERELLFSILRRLTNQDNHAASSSASIRNLIDTTQGCLRALEVIRVPVEHWDAILVFMIFNKMDQSSRELWEQGLIDSSIPKLKDLIQFLEQRARALSAGLQPQSQPRNKSDKNRPVNTHHAQPHTNEHGKCPLDCTHNHPLFRCQKFREFDVKKRTETLKKNSLCYNCFGHGHGVTSCPNKHSCKTCGRRHHTMIHQEQKKQSTSTPSEPVSAHHVGDSKVPCGVLATARVYALDCHGQPVAVRLLLDGGSPVSFVTEPLVKKLRLSLLPSNTEINGVGGAHAGISNAITSFVIKPHFKSNVAYTVKAFVLNKITNNIPASRMNTTDWDHLQNLNLADPDFDKSAPVDILIGSELFWTIVSFQKIPGPVDTPYAINSTLGWLVAGQSDKSKGNVTSYVVNLNLEETIQRFWEAESVPDALQNTKEEIECEEHFNKSYRRRPDGKFSVCIPWKSPKPILGTSRQQALIRLFQLERRFTPNSVKDCKKKLKLQQHKDDYISFMQEYENMGHMTLVPESKPSDSAIYIPHHFVVREQSSTTRLRVVFDASAKTSSGFSANDAMMVGPTLQDPLQDILLRFRKWPVAVTADIEKMYRQIYIQESDRVLRILWRKSPSEPVKEYVLNTVTYGTAAAPFLAVKSLQQLAVDEKERYPLASEIALTDFYVDDAAMGRDTPAEAIEAIRQLNEMCLKAGFPLRKYSSNSQEVMESIPLELRETKSQVNVDSSSPIKTLGIFWNPKLDVYSFTINLPQSSARCTKRSILSEISMIFDPIGWLSPVILVAKLLIQDLWRAKSEWDEDVPSGIEGKWKKMKNSFKVIEELTIPRCIMPGKPSRTVLVGFSDSSSYGYSACVYSVNHYENNPPISTLITAKTKVAPLSHLSIPRLELNGALLLASLLKSVLRALKHSFDEVRAYTDSTIVLAWITSSSPTRWKIYVRQRVQKIIDYIPDVEWYHVKSEDNCADCASRGLTPEELVQHPLWWNGNASMRSATPSKPIFNDDSIFESVKQEEQKGIIVHTAQFDENTAFLNRYSSFRRLQRVTAWIFRFHANSKLKSNTRNLQPLTVLELQHSRLALIRMVQRSVFNVEMTHLQKKKPIPTTSKILSLSPFLDSTGVLRVGGRLKNANVHPDRRHPILLPAKHHITRIIIFDLHEDYFHAGAQLLTTLLQQQFWIVNARDVVRQHIRKCPTCIRYRGESLKQFMGELPAERVNPSQPFSKCGVDYAGPILTRPPVRSKVTLKSYLAIFVCFSTRAIHIEVVESLSTDSFLAALRRFTSRRGKPTDIFSDCGTNFVGANRALKEIIQLCRSSSHNQQVADECSKSSIQWHFNPPNSPHFGGLWEAGVRSVKYHLNRVMGSSRYTYEELLTLTTQIEAILNSRPLIPASPDPADLQALTPAHLLHGYPLTMVPEPDFTEIKEGRLSRWQHLQQQKQHFWRRWSKEYITRLQQRPKWMQVSTNLVVNDMVIIKEDNLPPSKWNLGRVKTVHPGNDGIVRVATVITAYGEYKRAIHKLCLLPFNQSPPLDPVNTPTE